MKNKILILERARTLNSDTHGIYKIKAYKLVDSLEQGNKFMEKMMMKQINTEPTGICYSMIDFSGLKQICDEE